MKQSYRCAVLTISDKGAAGQRVDSSGPGLTEMLKRQESFQVVDSSVVADDKEEIKDVLCKWADKERIDLILSTGGTGVSPRDVTPEATREIIEKEIPGLAEAMRQTSLSKTPYAMLSRAVAGIRKTTLIINLPGSEKGAKDNLEAILAALPHAVYKIKGGTRDCGDERSDTGGQTE
ncbi:MAG: molybdenum cofactor biosynthesis protein B [Desulfurivibrionaceae bacterium]